jgi:hypothetical protein
LAAAGGRQVSDVFMSFMIFMVNGSWQGSTA